LSPRCFTDKEVTLRQSEALSASLPCLEYIWLRQTLALPHPASTTVAGMCRRHASWDRLHPPVALRDSVPPAPVHDWSESGAAVSAPTVSVSRHRLADGPGMTFISKSSIESILVLTVGL
jgi:hypothetical protein